MFLDKSFWKVSILFGMHMHYASPCKYTESHRLLQQFQCIVMLKSVFFSCKPITKDLQELSVIWLFSLLFFLTLKHEVQLKCRIIAVIWHKMKSLVTDMGSLKFMMVLSAWQCLGEWNKLDISLIWTCCSEVGEGDFHYSGFPFHPSIQNWQVTFYDVTLPWTVSFILFIWDWEEGWRGLHPTARYFWLFC